MAITFVISRQLRTTAATQRQKMGVQASIWVPRCRCRCAAMSAPMSVIVVMTQRSLERLV